MALAGFPRTTISFASVKYSVHSRLSGYERTAHIIPYTGMRGNTMFFICLRGLASLASKNCVVVLLLFRLRTALLGYWRIEKLILDERRVQEVVSLLFRLRTGSAGLLEDKCNDFRREACTGSCESAVQTEDWPS